MWCLSPSSWCTSSSKEWWDFSSLEEMSRRRRSLMRKTNSDWLLLVWFYQQWNYDTSKLSRTSMSVCDHEPADLCVFGVELLSTVLCHRSELSKGAGTLSMTLRCVCERIRGSLGCRVQSHPKATVLMSKRSVSQVSLSRPDSRQRTPWARWAPAKVSPRDWTALLGSGGHSGNLQRYACFFGTLCLAPTTHN